jgi:hypothetical protein
MQVIVCVNKIECWVNLGSVPMDIKPSNFFYYEYPNPSVYICNFVEDFYNQDDPSNNNKFKQYITLLKAGVAMFYRILVVDSGGLLIYFRSYIPF